MTQEEFMKEIKQFISDEIRAQFSTQFSNVIDIMREKCERDFAEVFSNTNKRTQEIEKRTIDNWEHVKAAVELTERMMQSMNAFFALVDRRKEKDEWNNTQWEGPRWKM